MSFQFQARQLEVGEVVDMDMITAMDKKELGLVEFVKKERKTPRKTKELKNTKKRTK